MTTEDLAELKARIETALADSIKEFGGSKGIRPRMTKRVMPIDMAWALANHDDTRAILTDPVVRAFGGTTFTVTVDEVAITVEPTAAPTVGPPAEPRDGVTVPADGVERNAALS